MNADARTLLVVDDDEALLSRLTKALEARHFVVWPAKSIAEALERARAESPEAALVDLRLPDGHGLDLVRELHAIDQTTRIVVLTGYGAIATAVQSLKLGASNYLTKPVDADQVVAALEDAPPAGTASAPGYTVPSLARVEWEHIQRVLTECDGNISQAARVLGLHRRSLQRKLAKYPVLR
jgi:two-component system response regulator RegA